MSRARLYRVSAIILRQRELREADRIVTLFTRERGKVSAVAKGVKRPRSKMAGGLQLFSHSHIQLAAGRSLAVVTQVQPADMFYHLRDDMERYAHASYASELVDVLTEEEDPDPRLFDLLLGTLRGLDEEGDPGTLARGLELKLMTWMGYGPELDACVSCGGAVKGGNVGFSAQQGGVVCGRCLPATGAGPVTPAGLRAMRELVRMPPEELVGRRLSRAVGEELARLTRGFVDYELRRPLRSAAFLTR